jgi:transcriptional pleiotropic regulator of transition state genes
MKSTGVQRPVDKLGRVVLPKEIRTAFDIKTEDKLDISIEGNKIILVKSENTCIFCDGTDDLVNFKDKKVCKACLEKLSTLA